MTKQTRKEHLRDRANRYGDAHRATGMIDPSCSWIDGYRTALKDVRRAVGKSGAPSALIKLLRPIR
jgi:hypothetical protein